MIQQGSWLNSADNTGGEMFLCIGLSGNTKRKSASIGDIITCSVKVVKKKNKADHKVKKGEVVRGVIVRIKQSFSRKDGSHLFFSDNALVVLDEKNMPIGTSIIGVIPIEIKEKFQKIVSLAKEIV